MSKMAVVTKLLVSVMLCGIVFFVPAPRTYGAGTESTSPASSSTVQPAEAGAQSTAPSPEERKPRLEVTWENRLITIDAVAADLAAVAKALSEKSGVEITLYEGITGKVTLHEEKAPLEKVVDRALASAGQRSYLMVFDGGGLTKLSIVPKGVGGAGLSDAAKRVKMKGKLRNGKEIEYFPGEIVVGIKTPPLSTEERIQRLERTYNLSLLHMNRVGYKIFAAKFRILDGRDPLLLMYELMSVSESLGISFATPNGLGALTAQMPEETFHFAGDLTDREGFAIRQRLNSDPQYTSEKHGFLKYDSLEEGKIKFGYIDKEIGISVAGSDVQRIGYDDIMGILDRENGILINYSKSKYSEGYTAYLAFLEDGPKVLGAKINSLGQDEVFKRAKEQFTGISHNSWGVRNGVAPDDELYSSGDQWNFTKIRAEHAWGLVPVGTIPATVAVIDSGIDGSHVDLVGRVSNLSKNFDTGEVGKDWVPDDSDGHGTAVAGIFGAITKNAKGIAGVAGGWGTEKAGAQILALRARNSIWEDQRDAILYALDKADVLNLSWDWWNRHSDLYPTIEGAYAQGKVIVVAADNLDGEFNWAMLPAYIQALRGKVIVVAATTRNDGRWDDGGIGFGSAFGDIVDVSAPGDHLIDTLPSDNYGPKSGTSFAAPQVAGVAAVLLGMGRTQAEVYALIKGTADPLSYPNLLWDGKMGTGRINSYAALRVAQGHEKDSTPPGKPSDTQLIPGPGNIRVTWTATDTDNNVVDAVGESLLYRRTSPGMICANPETIADAQYCQVALVRSSQPDGTAFAYTDSAISESNLYYYRIVAVDKTGNRSVPSDELGPAQIDIPSAPSNLASVTGDSSVALSWTAPTTNRDGSQLTDLAGYKVYYDTDEPGAPYDGIGAAEGNSPIFVPTSGAASEAFTLHGLSNDGNTIYYIIVRAVDAAGNESADPEWVYARPMNANWVPGEFGTLQQALDAAPSGSVVMVGAGTYVLDTASLILPATGITLMSESGPGRTVIDGGNLNLLTLKARTDCRIIGFTFRHGAHRRGSVECYFSRNVLVANNVFVSNLVGVYTGGNFEPTRIYNNTFVGNTEGEHAAYLGIVDLRNNIFHENGIGIWTGKYVYEYAPGAFYRTTIVHNDFFSRVGQTKIMNAITGLEMFEEFPGNQQDDPLFVRYDPADAVGGDYRLRADSPVRDQGDDALEMKSIGGLDWRWDPDGSRTDLGAYGGPYTGYWRENDHDLDGITDALDPDDDNDCLPDAVEDANGNGIFELALGETNSRDADTDDDGLTDGNCGSEDLNANGIFEPQFGESDPRSADSDGDGIQDGTKKGLAAPESADTDLAVFIADADPGTTTDPLNPDGDGDGLLDGEEDIDHDGAADLTETDPVNPDSDGDGYNDGVEVAGGSNPLDPASVPNHPPAIPALTVAQRTDGSALAAAVFTGSDAEGDHCTLAVKEVSRDGATWVQIPVSAGDPAHTAMEPLHFSEGGSGYTLVWDARAAFGALEDGEVYLRLQPHDGRLAGEPLVSAPFALDTVAPRIAISVPELANGPVTPAVTVTDGLDTSPAVTMTLDGSPWSGGTVSTDGWHTLAVAARDDYGNGSSASAQFTVDGTPPQIVFEGAVEGGVYETDITLSWRAADNLDRAPALGANYSSPQLFSFSGDYTVQVTATDAAGNGAARSLSFAIYDLEDLSTIIEAMSIEAGLKDSLLAKVQNVLAAKNRGSSDAAVNLLEAFIHAVEAQRGKKIALADADGLIDFATHAIALLRNAWSSLALGEVFMPADDPALTSWDTLLTKLEANAVSRIVLEVYRAEGTGAGRLLLAPAAAWTGRGTLAFTPPFAFDAAAFLAEAERRGIDVLAGMGALSGGAAAGDALHLGHLVDMADYLLRTYPGIKGVCMTDLSAPGEAAAVSALAGAVQTRVASETGRIFALLVGSPANAGELLDLAAEKGQDLAVLGGTAEVLYLGTFVDEDSNSDGLPDHDASWPGQVVSYLGSLHLAAGLVPLVPMCDVPEPFEDLNANGTWDAGEPYADGNGDGRWGVAVPMTPARITAIVSGLPGDLIRGIAVHRYADTAAAEWSALLDSHPR